MENNKYMSFPRDVVGNLPLSKLLMKEKKQPYLIKQAEDPRQKPSGMTSLFDNGNNGAGFTLIELLVVVLIIGILAAVAVPQYQKAVIRSRLNALKHLVQAIAQSEESYYLTNGSYTSSFEELDIELPTPLNYSTRKASYQGVTGGYHYANYDWGNCFIYRTADDSNAHAACQNTDAGIGYAVGFAHSVAYQNKRTCFSLNKNAQRVCLAETSNETPYYASETDHMWNYYYR